MTDEAKFCIRCGGPLAERSEGGRARRACTREGCGWVHYGNPFPVVAALVEHEGKVLLARNHGWPEKLFGLVAGFLEAGESPEAGVLREVKEELGLTGEVVSLIGVYPFEMRNEVIIAFHVRAQGTVQLGEELAGYKAVDPDKLRPWEFGTGLAVGAWLKARGRATSG